MAKSSRAVTPREDFAARDEIAKYKEIINTELGGEGSESVFLDSYNRMFDFFEDSYEKNTQLLSFIKKRNLDIIQRAEDARKLMKASDQSPTEAKAAQEEFSKAISAFEAARSNLVFSQSKIDELRAEIEVLKQRFKKSDEEIDAENEIDTIRREIIQNEQTIQDFEANILIEKETVANIASNMNFMEKEICEMGEEISEIDSQIPIDVLNQNSIDLLQIIKEQTEETKILEQQINEKTIQVSKIKEVCGSIKTNLNSEQGFTMHDFRQKYQFKLNEIEKENQQLSTVLNHRRKRMTVALEKNEALEKKLVLVKNEQSDLQKEYERASEEYHRVRHEKQQMMAVNKEMKLEKARSFVNFGKSLNETKAASIIVQEMFVKVNKVQQELEKEAKTTKKSKEDTENAFSHIIDQKQESKTITSVVLELLDEIDADKVKSGLLNQQLYAEIMKVDDFHIQNAKLEKKLKKTRSHITKQSNLNSTFTKERDEQKKLWEMEAGVQSVLEGKNKQLSAMIHSYVEHLGHLHNSSNKTRVTIKYTKEISAQLRKMIVQTKEGRLITEQTNAHLMNEQKMLNRIIQQNEFILERQQQEYDIMIANYELINNRLKAKEKQIEELKSTILTNEHIVTEGSRVYKLKIEEIKDRLNEMEFLFSRCDLAEKHIAEVKQMRNQVMLIENQVISEKLKAVAFAQDIEVPRNVHRWQLMECHDPQEVAQLRFRCMLLGELSESDLIIDKLREEKENLTKKLKEMNAFIESSKDPAQVEFQIQKYQKHLIYQEDMIAEINAELEEQRKHCQDSARSNAKVESKYKEKISQYAQLRVSNAKLSAEEPEEIPWFITEPSPRACVPRAAGFQMKIPKLSFNQPVKSFVHIPSVILSARKPKKSPFCMISHNPRSPRPLHKPTMF